MRTHPERDERIATFLRAVWSKQGHHAPGNRFYFLSSKDWASGAGDWHEHSYTEPPDYVPTYDDLYFAPVAFSDSRRLREHALRGRFLYADLDAVDPLTLSPAATLAWETSPGRWQALWLLDRDLEPDELEDLNRRMTYYTGADRGGWSLTKVLRVPYTRSNKREDVFTVRLSAARSSRKTYRVEDIRSLLADVTDDASSASVEPLPADSELPSHADAHKRHYRRLPIRARQLLSTKNVVKGDDRSARLWELENLLVSADVPLPDALVLLRETVWNKYRGQRRELRMLWKELSKARAAATAEPPARKIEVSPSGLLPNTLPYDDFMARDWPKPSWLVKGTWTKGAYGILAGEYKSFKTMLLLDLALSVASGTPFLGKHEVHSSGAVCYVHEEGRPWSIHDRLARIAHGKGLSDRFDPESETLHFNGRSLPIYVTSVPRLNLREDASQDALHSHVKATRPELLILETFYLLSGGAVENAVEEVSPILEYLAGLSHEFGCAVILSHHFHKSGDAKRFTDRTSGSSVFLRWYESGLFVERTGDDSDNTIRVVASHRDGAPMSGNLRFLWDSEDGGLSYTVEHLDDEDVSDDARQAEVILSGVADAQASPKAPKFTPRQLADVHDYVARAGSTGLPLSLVKNAFGLARTEHAQALCRRAGLRITTRNGKRTALLSPDEQGAEPEGR